MSNDINIKSILEELESLNKTAEEELNAIFNSAVEKEDAEAEAAKAGESSESEDAIPKEENQEETKTAEENQEETKTAEVEDALPKESEDLNTEDDELTEKVAALEESGKIIARAFVEELNKIATAAYSDESQEDPRINIIKNIYKNLQQ